MTVRTKMEKWKYKILLIYLICGIVILYPFMAIKYFETITPNVIALTYFTPFILITTFVIVPIFYFKKVIPVDHDLKRQKKAGTIVSTRPTPSFSKEFEIRPLF